ncbi:GNAT family N-acetyltransferase [Herbiconiux flava]|uniref:RimJ/RimL family protein N-acetyltransferase n=1 Tax=Herbiconiux flava TaxID=881268 RepID=A0A852SHY9_9MICO|nr:GNAT family protein [Herbiconiux flava]NYD69314.1 RimJ/RimL family protein N-acetyltransferase [Herbiconiux flava]GLK16060.1 alanine acetyltransferase [Herbiconiux flava]
MSAVRPDPDQALEGRYVRLEGLTHEVLPELYAAIGHPEVFAGGYGGGPQGYRDSVEGFVEFAEGYYQWGRGNPYVIRLVGGPDAGRVVGTTTLGDFEPAFEAAHIGWTAYDPRVWGTVVNPEAKLLLLGAAFEQGFGRVKIQADVLNSRSRAAIAKLGATFEGIVRRDRPRADGSWRDSAVFSVIVDDWPAVQAGLRERVENQGGGRAVQL